MNISWISLITLKFWTLLHHESCHVERNITLKLRNNVWSYCYAELRAAMRKPFRNLMTARRQGARLRGCHWCERGKMKKKCRETLQQSFGQLPHHLQTMTPSKARSRDSSPPHDSHDFSIISMRVFTETMCHPQVLPNLTHKSIKSKFWCSFKILKVYSYLQSTISPDTASLDVFLQRWVATSARSDELLRPAAGRFRGGSCHRGESYRWSSNDWC